MSRLRKLIRTPREFIRDALHRRLHGEVPSSKIFWTCPSAAAASDSLKAIRELISWGRTKEAVLRLEEERSSASANFESSFLLATLLAHGGDDDQALEIAEDLGKLEPGHFGATLLRAGLWRRAERPVQAINILSTLTERAFRPEIVALSASIISGCPLQIGDGFGDFSVSRLNRIAAALRTAAITSDFGALEKAIPRGDRRHACLALEAAIGLLYPPPQIEAMLCRLIRRGKLTFRHFCHWATERALFVPFYALRGLRPRQITHFNLLLGIARQLDQDRLGGEALPFVEYALRAGESSIGTLMLAANLNRSLGRYDEAADFYKRLLDLRPDDDLCLESLAQSEREGCLDQPERPWDLYNSTVERLVRRRKRELAEEPASFSRRLAYARTLVRFEVWGDAIGVLESLLAEYSEEGDVLWNYMMACCALGRLEEASTLGISYLGRKFDDRILTMVCSLLRNSDRVELAEKIIASFAGDGHRQTRSQEIRTLFFTARFREAWPHLQAFLESHPSDLGLRLLAVATALELGDLSSAERHLRIAAEHPERIAVRTEMHLLRYAVLRKSEEIAAALGALNEMFDSFGLRHVRLHRGSRANFFDSLEAASKRKSGVRRAVRRQPLVTVIMTTFNSAEYVSTALKSILGQGYRNLELLVVDDHSSDETLSVLDRFAGRDTRVRVIPGAANSGTYVCKNIALQQARGDYIAFQDSDDWSHPDRIEKSVAVLAASAHLVGINTAWLRMTTEGEIVIRPMGDISSMSCISLVMKRAAFEQLGFFDSVRIGADTELIGRGKAHFGRRAIPYLRWPMLLGRSRSNSLTTSGEVGIFRTRLSEPRRLYDNAYKGYHREIAEGGSPYMPFPLTSRKFPAPEIILPGNV